MDESIKNKFNQFIYNESNSHAEKILESILPELREALAKAYAQGFMKGLTISKINKKNEKS